MHPHPLTLAALELANADPRLDGASDSRLDATRHVESNGGSIQLSEMDIVADSGPTLGPGDCIGDIYCIERELGGGAMGIVLSAIDRTLARRVAIKLIRGNLLTTAFRSRFMSEARAMALVSHPNVLTIYAFGEHHGQPFMVMELVEGQTLDTWLLAQEEYPDLDLSLRILNQVCLGVSAIHGAGTLHRDLKPSNILLDSQLRARVSDLGLAIPVQDGASRKEVVGTPGYIAPEIQFDIAHGGASQQSDLYSLACMAYEILTGRPPFEADEGRRLAILHATADVPSPSSIRPELPHAFDEVLLRALAKDPRERTQSVELLRRSLIEARNDSLEPVRILVAEDDPDFRDLVELVLHSEFPGADIECVPDGKRAVAAFDRRPASVLVVDLQMPEMDGMAVTALVRARPGGQRVPIIVLTASGGSREWQLLSSLGADRLLVKPIDLDDLIGTIRRAIRQRSSKHPG